MTSFSNTVVEARRLYLLQLLFKSGGESSQRVLQQAMPNGFRPAPSALETKHDIDHLVMTNCIDEEFLDDTVRSLKITDRGIDAAHSRIHVAGVARDLNAIWPV